MSREEAIAKLKEKRQIFIDEWADLDDIVEAFDMAIEALQDRPTDEWCTDCKEYDHEKHCCPRFNRVIRTTLNEAVANLKEEFGSAEYDDYEHATLVDIKEPLKVSVVRCKDCRHWLQHEQFGFDEDNDEYHDYCALLVPDDDYYAYTRKADDFCSYGERKQDD